MTATSWERKAKWRLENPDRWAMYGRAQMFNKRARRAYVPGSLRLDDLYWVLDRDGRQCVFCGIPTEGLDHATPISRGGWNKIWNLQVCCEPCNHRKARRTNLEFIGNRLSATCVKGHQRTEANTYLRRGGGECRDCRHIARKREAESA